jgi:glycosyltransferase involved in cell wall biosynthesis
VRLPRKAPAAGAPLRFAILSSCVEPWGGSEELWWQAACALRARGHRVDVLKTKLSEEHPRIRELRARGCSVRDIGRTGFRLAAMATAVLPAQHEMVPERRQMIVAAAALLRRRADLAIVSQGQNFDGHHLALVCTWLRIPYIIVSQKATEMHWPADWARPYASRVFATARHAIFVSEHNLRLTERQLGAALPRAVVLRNPVLAAGEGALPWPDQNGGLRLACVARLYPAEKGQDLLLEALAEQRWRERPLHVDFYGDGLQREGLARMARHLGVERVTFMGHTDAIEDVWRTHHGLVLPSRAEGLPLALVEAMRCGRVPIVTDVGGNAEVVQDPTTGFVAAGATVAHFADALERAWEAREQWRSIGDAAAERIAALVPDGGESPLAEMAIAEARAGPNVASQCA